MSFWWRLEPPLPAADAADLAAEPRHDDQNPAEEWLGVNNHEHDALGVRRVSLLEEDRLIYGPMSLES